MDEKEKNIDTPLEFGTSGLFGDVRPLNQAASVIPPASGMQRMVDAGLRRDNFGLNNTRAIADEIYGTVEQRQMSMPQTPVFLEDQDGSGDITQKDLLIKLGKLDKEGNKTEKY